jgi:hypothetical protein
MKKEKKKIKIDFGIVLLITGTLANISMWIGAFSSTEAKGPVGEWIALYLLPILGSFSGLAMGVTAVAGLVLVMIRLSAMQPTFERKVRGKDEYKTLVNYRYWMTAGVLALLIVASWALLSPFAFAQLSGSQNLYVLMGDGLSRWWAFGRIAAADLVIIGLALVQGTHAGANRSAGDGPQGNTLSDGKQPTANRSARSAKKSKPLSNIPCRFAGAGCARTFASQNAANAHARTCEYKPMKIDQSLLIKASEENKK